MRSCISLYDLFYKENFYKENEHHKITSPSGAPMAAYLRGVLYFSQAGIFSVGLSYLTKGLFLSEPLARRGLTEPKALDAEGLEESDSAENVTVCSHVVVSVEQLSCEGFVVEVVGEATHHIFKIVVLLDDMPCEVFFAIPLSAVVFLTKPSASR